MQSHTAVSPLFPQLSNCWHFAFWQIYWTNYHEGVYSVCNCVWVGGASQVATHMNAMTQGFPTKSFEIISDFHFTCQDQTSNVGAHHWSAKTVNTRACYWQTVKLDNTIKSPRREPSCSCRVRLKSNIWSLKHITAWLQVHLPDRSVCNTEAEACSTPEIICVGRGSSQLHCAVFSFDWVWRSSVSSKTAWSLQLSASDCVSTDFGFSRHL